MIQLTRLNNHPFVVNSDLIKFVERSPDTLVTLINGEKLVVRESVEEVLTRVIQFRRSVLDGFPQAWNAVSGQTPAIQPAASDRRETER